MSESGTPAGARLVAGRYRLTRELGRGGMGAVWLADDQLTGRQVAVKELRPPPGLTDADRDIYTRRALQEARSAARIHHPNAVTLFDVLPATPDDDTVYLIMEFIDGPTLAAVIRRDGPQPADAVAAWGLQLLDVLEAAHSLGIVHRDIKPANILITPAGQAKLTDFGIAHTLGEPRLTRSGVMGTHAYMAPELFNSEPITPAADLWSLGATLYHAADGRGPFDRGNTGAVLRAILLDTLPVPHCSAPLAVAIGGMLERDPARRATIEQARTGLRQAVAQAPQQEAPAAAPPSVPARDNPDAQLEWNPHGTTGLGSAADITDSSPAPVPASPSDASTAPPPSRAAWDPSATTKHRPLRDAPADDTAEITPEKRGLRGLRGLRSLRGLRGRIGRRAAIAAITAVTLIAAAIGAVLALSLDSGRTTSAGLSAAAATSQESSGHPASASGGPASAKAAASRRSRTPGRSRSTHHASRPGGSGGGKTPGRSATHSGSPTTTASHPSTGGHSSTSPAPPPKKKKSPATLTAHVFWKGSNGDLWEAQGSPTGGLGSPADLGVALGSGPAVGADGSGDIAVYWEGTGNDLSETYWNGSSWSGPENLGIVLGSAPTVAVTSGGTADVFWKGTNGYLQEAYGPANPADGGLTGPITLTQMGPIGSPPAAATNGNGDVSVYWEGTANEHMWEGYWNGSSWSSPLEQNAATIGTGGPSAAVTPGGTAYVFWEGTNGNVYEAQGPASGGLGGASDISITGTLGSPPGAGGANNGGVYVYWSGLGHAHVWEGTAPTLGNLTEVATASLSADAPAVAFTG